MKKMPILIVIAYVIIVAGLVAIFARMTINRAGNHHEHTYILVNNCILAVPPSERTHRNIEDCYRFVEKQSHTQLERYYLSD